jgi:DNA-3-methyladenine glycosylase
VTRLGGPLPRSFLDGDVAVVAAALLGRVVVAQVPEGRIAVRLTEVEAYDGRDDPASHAFRGPTPRNAVMFGPPGYLYTYFVYGMHWCANIVTGPVGRPSAVLLRAGEVVDGVAAARARRPRISSDHLLARGPAGLASVLGFDRAANGTDLCGADGRVRLHLGSPPAADDVRVGPRVGVATAADVELRFWIAQDPTVSVFRAWTPRRRTAKDRGNTRHRGSAEAGAHSTS